MAVPSVPGIDSNLLVDLGWKCIYAGDYANALTFLYRATLADIGSARAHMALAEALLATGRLRRGWQEFTWRSFVNGPSGAIQTLQGPPWSGEPMPNGRLLVVCDEGYGDMIQFARFIPKAAELCKEIVLGWDPVLAPLLGGMPCVTSAHDTYFTIPPVDGWVLICDLAGIFGVTVDTIPAQVPYLAANRDKSQHWGEKLNTDLGPGKLRVGLFWSGRPTHPQNARRSLRLSQLAPLFDVEGVQFFGIQIPVPEHDKEEIARRANLTDLSTSVSSFADTMAIVTHLDLVITVDSVVAHLAGALGKPVWTLVYKPADWRWLIDRPDTPWYPTMRLFHQETMGDWDPVIRRVAGELQALAKL